MNEYIVEVKRDGYNENPIEVTVYSDNRDDAEKRAILLARTSGTDKFGSPYEYEAKTIKAKQGF